MTFLPTLIISEIHFFVKRLEYGGVCGYCGVGDECGARWGQAARALQCAQARVPLEILKPLCRSGYAPFWVVYNLKIKLSQHKCCNLQVVKPYLETLPAW